MPRLTVTSDQPPSEFQFDETIVIGRGGTADFVVANPSVSRRHAMLTNDGGEWFVEDLGSGNGTFLNDRIISQRSTLVNRDQIRLGSVVPLFESTVEADTPVPVPSTTSIRMRDAPAANEPDRVLVRVPVVEEAASPHTMVGSARRLRLLENLAKISSMVFDERALLSFVVDEL